MKTEIPFEKSIMMDKVLKELKAIISTLVVKLDCEAEKYETLETRKAADEYIVAMKHQDSFFSYENYSEYALNRAGLGNYYMVDKRLIPNEYRGNLVTYQRDFVIKSYIEKNEYYRMLNGLPSLINKEEDYVYVTEIVEDEIEGVDSTKPLHEMDENEIIILNTLGYLELLQKKHPDKKYLNHLLEDRRIDIIRARNANPYEILYIHSDRTKQPITEMFMTIYNKSRDYVLERFYDVAYEYKNDYYANYIGLFILTITVQRFITNYFHKFINRDFYDKDIIKLLFDSYDIPFYNEIPLTYSQKVAKNLNRLLYYKSTNRVFVDIFKIFDMENIQVCNYVLFKNPKVDDVGKPVLIYNEKTEVGYQVDTVTNVLQSTDDFYGSFRKDYKNIKKIIELKYNNQYCKVILLSNGIINFDTEENTDFFKTINNYKHSYDDYNHLQFDEYFNVQDIKLLIDTDGKTTYAAFLCKQTNLIYTFKHDKIEKFDLKELFSEVNITPDSVLIKQDEISLKKMIIVNKKETSLIYLNLNGTYRFETELDEVVVNGDFFDNAISLAMSSGKLFLYGDNKDYRLLNRDSLYLNSFTEENDIIMSVKDVKILKTGCIFILKNGTVRYSRSVPILSDIKVGIHETDIIKEYKNIKGIFDLEDGNKKLYFLITYSGEIMLLNYSYTDKLGQLLFRSNTNKPTCKYFNIRNIAYIHDGILITTYASNSKICFSGLNEDKRFPFISTFNMITEENKLNIEFTQIYKSYFFFTTYDNKIGIYVNNEVKYIGDELKNEEIQDFIHVNDSLYILIGKKYLYRIYGESEEDFRIEKIELDKIITNIFKPNNNDLIAVDNNSNTYKLKDGILTPITDFIIEYQNEEEYVKITKNKNNKFLITYKNSKNTFNNKIIYNVNRIFRAIIINNVIFLEGDKIYYIKISEFSNSYNDIDAYTHKELTTKLAKSEIILDNLFIYNKTGGISLLKGFIHSDRLDAHITTDHLSLFDDKSYNIRQVMYDENNIILLKDEAAYVTYEEALDEMYDLSFIEVPMEKENKAEYIADTQYHLNYDVVTNDDKLWGGDIDKKTFIKEILKDEFNYYTSKYISVNSTYDLIKLNFEVCYMFRMLSELKDNEKYLSTNVKYVGDNVHIFDIVVGLFALACKKFGLEGNIVDTKTKAMTVLGFNFKLDMKYIDKIIKDANLEEVVPDFEEEDMKIKMAPKLFSTSSQFVNLYLDNEQVMQNIYTYKYESKTIEEYNAWKRIEMASLYSEYTNEIYEIEKGKIAKTYLEYLKYSNPAMYNLVNDADPDNMIEEIDYLLLALTDYLSSEKYKYLFLNIPSLSMDSLRKFVYYLIDIFKSYTVDLKAMNIIYHIDDKRIHNIKLILDEDNFKKIWCDYDKIKYVDLIDITFTKFAEYDRIKMIFKENFNSEFTYEELSLLFKTYRIILSQIDEKRGCVIKDFSDYFSKMDKRFEIEKTIKLADEILYNRMIPLIDKFIIKDDILIGESTLDKFDTMKFKEFLKEEVNVELFDKIVLLDMCELFKIHGWLNESEYIELIEKIKSNKMTISSKGLLGDHCDFIEFGNSTIDKNNKINIRDKYHFIRNE